jgi:hypothetical protein
MQQATPANSTSPHSAPSAPIDAPDELPPEEESHLSFWQQPFVQNVLPFLTSLAVHVTLILVGVLTYKAIVQSQVVSEEQIIVPDAAIVAGDVGGIPNPGLGDDPNRKAASDLVPENTQSEGWNRQPSKSLQAAVLGGSGDTANDTIIGVGAGASLGKGKGLGVGSGEGEGASAPFGVPGGGRGIGPRSPFMGVSGNAKTVVYFCDASGSMIGLRMDLLKIELKKAVDALVPVQAFNVIFFSGDEFQSLSKTLVMATPENKRKTYEFIDGVKPRSSTEPFKALNLAFSNKPQLMYVLSDGFDQIGSFSELIAYFDKLNVKKQTRVNTIAFFSPREDQTTRKECEDALRQIAKDNGGQFKVVLTTDLTQ